MVIGWAAAPYYHSWHFSTLTIPLTIHAKHTISYENWISFLLCLVSWYMPLCDPGLNYHLHTKVVSSSFLLTRPWSALISLLSSTYSNDKAQIPFPGKSGLNFGWHCHPALGFDNFLKQLLKLFTEVMHFSDLLLKLFFKTLSKCPL